MLNTVKKHKPTLRVLHSSTTNVILIIYYGSDPAKTDYLGLSLQAMQMAFSSTSESLSPLLDCVPDYPSFKLCLKGHLK